VRGGWIGTTADNGALRQDPRGTTVRAQTQAGPEIRERPRVHLLHRPGRPEHETRAVDGVRGLLCGEAGDDPEHFLGPAFPSRKPLGVLYSELIRTHKARWGLSGRGEDSEHGARVSPVLAREVSGPAQSAAPDRST
jgi:hypothetical protein